MPYNVPLIPQPTDMACWAASIAMIRSWKDNACYDPQAIAEDVGGINYMPSLKSGLDPNDKYILKRNGLTVEAPQCYTPGAIQGKLQAYGPLWVATWAPGAHIRVVTGMINDTVYINDPWPVGIGKQYTMSFSDFFGAMEDLGSQELSQPSPVYLAHY